MLCQKRLLESCRMSRRNVAMKLICSLNHCECDRHTVHKLGQRRLTVSWLAPQESDCSQMHSEVSSDWPPSYIKATQPVLDIFKVDGYFPAAIVYVHSNLLNDFECHENQCFESYILCGCDFISIPISHIFTVQFGEIWFKGVLCSLLRICKFRPCAVLSL